MNIISLKDYAKEKNISYEAVRQQVVRYKDELGSHVIKDGRQQFLDEEAVAFLDAKRQKNPVAIIRMDKDEQIEELEQEKSNLLIKIAEQADKIAQLSEWKADHAIAIAEANQKQLLLEENQKKIEYLENSLKDANKLIEEKTEAEKAVEDKLHFAEQRAEQLQAQLDAERNKTFLQRLFGK